MATRRSQADNGDAEAGEVAEARRAGGRPREEAIDVAILRAAQQLLTEDGFSGMSIARVAEVAGVGRPAVYRRYRDKSDLVLAAIEDMRSRMPTPDSGRTRDDVVALLEIARRKFDMGLAGTLLVEEAEHPELLEKFRARMIQPAGNQVIEVIERGQERGEVRPDLDPVLAAQALMGSFTWHYMYGGRPKKGWSERVVENLWPAFAAENGRGRKSARGRRR
jgi:AcrR family transcriptional regulator